MESAACSGLDDDLQLLVDTAFSNNTKTVIPRYRYKGTTISDSFLEILDVILDMEVREDDIWICAHFKSGTHWTSEMAWMIANNLDFEGAKVLHTMRVPHLEFEHIVRGSTIKEESLDKTNIDLRVLTQSVDYVKTMKSPRVIQTHLPFHMLPLQLQRGTVKAKIIHTVRNPMDVCWSYFLQYQNWYGFQGSIDEFSTLFMRGGLRFSPFWLHCISYIEKKDDINVLSLKFEDMIKDLPAVIRQTADFLNKTLTAEQAEALNDYLSFTNMKSNRSVNCLGDIVLMLRKLISKEDDCRRGKWELIRNGAVGEGKASFSPELVQRFRKWTEDNTKGTVLEKPLGYYGFDD